MDMDKTLTLLNRQIAYARANAPFYRYLPVQPLQSLDELARLPLTSARDIALHGRYMLCCSPASVRRMVTMRTSGTTGAPKRLAFTDADLEDTVGFFCRGMNLLCSAGDTVGIFMPGHNPDGLCDLLSRGIERFGGIPAVFGPIADYIAAAAFCRQRRPRVLVGVPAQMRRLALTAPDLRPARVLVSADYAAPAVIETLERVWGCEALVHFGMTESGLGCAVETPARDGMHIRGGILLETLPDGELVLTTLRREGMPLIRYRTGDAASLLPNGNLGAVYGRMDELRSPVSAPALDRILFAQDAVLDYSAALCENRLTVRAAGGGVRPKLLQDKLAAAFPGFSVEVLRDKTVCSNGIAKRRIRRTGSLEVNR